MQNIRTNYLTLKEVEKELISKISSSFLSNITLLSNVDLLMSFSHYRKEKLLISLNHSSPFVSLIEIDESFQTIMSPLNDVLRKELKDTKLIELHLMENDRIFEFKFEFTNELFEKETRYLILELIPTKPNLFVLGKDKKILFATHYSDITKTRPILKNTIYEKPLSQIKGEQPAVDLSDFKESVMTYFEEIKIRRLKSKYSKLFTLVNKKIKSLEKKKEKIANDIINAKSKLVYKDYGDLMFTLFNEPSMLNEYLENEYLKDYDESLDLKGNANRYFKIYKKAKNAIVHGEEEIKKADEEIQYYTHLKTQIENGSDEDISQIEFILFGPNKITPKNKIKNVSPYHIDVDGAKIYFGKSDMQNDKLTFSLSSPFHHFFHIKDYPGAHVVIFNDLPSDEQILTACEICLILSKKDDGDISFTQIKNVRKGHNLGQVILKSFNTIHLSKIRESTRKLIKTATR